MEYKEHSCLIDTLIWPLESHLFSFFFIQLLPHDETIWRPFSAVSCNHIKMCLGNKADKNDLKVWSYYGHHSALPFKVINANKKLLHCLQIPFFRLFCMAGDQNEGSMINAVHCQQQERDMSCKPDYSLYKVILKLMSGLFGRQDYWWKGIILSSRSGSEHGAGRGSAACVESTSTSISWQTLHHKTGV